MKNGNLSREPGSIGEIPLVRVQLYFGKGAG